MVLVVLGAIIIGVARYISTDSVVEFATWISIAWWFIVVLLVISGLLDAFRGGLLASVDIFEAAEAGTLGSGNAPDPIHLYVSDRELLPIHVPTGDGSRMQPNNWSSIWVLAGCCMSAAWGLGMSFVLSPAYPGTAVGMIALVIALIFALEVSRVTSDRIDEACAIIDGQAIGPTRRFATPSRNKDEVEPAAGDAVDLESGETDKPGEEQVPVPGSLALREVVLRAAKTSLSGSRSQIATGASDSLSGAVDPSDVSIDVGRITAGKSKLIGQASELMEAEDAQPAVVAAARLLAVRDALAYANASFGLANFAGIGSL